MVHSREVQTFRATVDEMHRYKQFLPPYLLQGIMAYTGTCKKWLNDKGFGFIEPNDGGEDIFVHQSELYCEGFRQLTEGDQVEYDVTTDRGRQKATNVTGPRGAPIPAGKGGKGDYGGGKGGKGDYGGGKGKVCFSSLDTVPPTLLAACSPLNCLTPYSLLLTPYSVFLPQRGGKGKGGDGCFNCGSTDHWSRECPDGKGGGGGGGRYEGGGGGRSYGGGGDRYAPY